MGKRKHAKEQDEADASDGSRTNDANNNLSSDGEDIGPDRKMRKIDVAVAADSSGEDSNEVIEEEKAPPKENARTNAKARPTQGDREKKSRSASEPSGNIGNGNTQF